MRTQLLFPALIAACTGSPSLPEAGPPMILPPPPTRTVVVSPSAAATIGGAFLIDHAIGFSITAAEASFPLAMPVGCILLGWRARTMRDPFGPVMTAALEVAIDGAVVTLDGPIASGPGLDTVGGSVDFLVDGGRAYEVRVRRLADSSVNRDADRVYWASVTYVCP